MYNHVNHMIYRCFRPNKKTSLGPLKPAQGPWILDESLSEMERAKSFAVDR